MKEKISQKATDKKLSTGAKEELKSDNNLKELEQEDIIVPEEITQIIDKLPKEEQHRIVRTIMAIERSSSFRGPLPPPDILEGYEKILPGASERILKMAEKQQDHRICMEATIIGSQTKQSGRGQKIGAFLAFFFGLIAFFLGYFGHDVLAGTIGSTTIISLAVIFVLNKEPNQEENPKESEKKD